MHDARGRHEARRDDVDAHLRVVDLLGQAGGEALERRLAHAVDGAAPARRVPGGMQGRMGGDVENPARAALAHVRQHELGELERRPHLHVHHQPEPLLRKLRHRDEVGDGGVVHQDVDGAERLPGLLDQAVAILGTGQVRLHGDGLPARCLDALDRVGDRARQIVIRRFHRAGRGDDLCPFHGEPAGDRLADAAAGAGDHGDLAGQHPVRIDRAHAFLSPDESTSTIPQRRPRPDTAAAGRRTDWVRPEGAGKLPA